MLRHVMIVCPFCAAETKISVSTGDGKDMHGSRSPCRACRQPIITVTLADGQIAFFKEDRLFLLDPVSAGRAEMPRRRQGERHQVLLPQNLGLFDRGVAMEAPAGISDAELEKGVVLPINRLLWRPDGTRRPAKDAARHYGWRSVWMAELNHNLQLRLSRPPPFSEPPTIFLSYRWGGQAHNDWVAALAEKLSVRGYRVTLDQLVPPGEMVVPAFVSGVADCRYFLAIIDPGYVERLGTKDSSSVVDGWVFDEVNNAVSLENRGLLRIVGLLREGTELPTHFSFPSFGQPGNTIDVRDPALLSDFLDDVFPDRREATDAAKLKAAEDLYWASIEALGHGEHQKAFDLASELVEQAPALIDGYVQQVRVCLASGAYETGLAVAAIALEEFPDLAELDLAAAQFALELGEFAQAARHAARVLQASRVPVERCGPAHAVLGNALDEFDQVDAALAHLSLAIGHFGRRPRLLQDLGLLHRRMAEPEMAADIFAEALQADPASVPLRVNHVAALIEAGEAAQAREALAELAATCTDPKVVAFLGDRLAELETTGIPVALSPRVAAPTGAVRMTCSACPAALVVDKAQSLCFGCGCARQRGTTRCPFCDADGQVRIGAIGNDAAYMCPFCRKGTLAAEAMPA
jgi:tetratricopeptide (TPR) repeat protein